MNLRRITPWVLWILPTSVSAQTSTSLLAEMDLEDLMQVKVTTVTKRKQDLGDSAAAVYVITQEDIRRSGAVALPEVLELAPNIQAERSSRWSWAIGSRGMLSSFADKLLVMVDGRSVYNPLFGGVNWENVVPSLNEIEQIEIIAGPGTSIWGANSINGVINIITYDSEVTQQSRIVAGAGNEEKSFLRAREAFRQGDLSGRVNVDYRSADESLDPTRNTGANDAFSTRQISTRIDWKPTLVDDVSWDAGYTETSMDGRLEAHRVVSQFFTPPANHLGSQKGWGMTTWLHELTGKDSLQLKIYLDWEDRTDLAYEYYQETFDVDLQYVFPPIGQHQLTGGIASRKINTETKGTYIFSFSDDTLSFDRKTGFIQNEYSATENITITAGVKYEDNHYVDPEVQPTLRVGYSFDDTGLAWAAWSRAARTPGGVEHVFNWRLGIADDVKSFLDTLQPGLSEVTYINGVGNDDFESELADIYEVGIRKFFQEQLSFELSLYYAKYDQLRTTEMVGFSADEFIPGYYRFVLTSGNNDKGYSKGGELLVRYHAFDSWRLSAAVAHTQMVTTQTHNPPVGKDYYDFISSATPKNTGYVLSQFDFGDGWETDFKIRYAGKKLALTETHYPIPAYYDVSARIGKQITSEFRLSLIGKQLTDGRRTEMVDTFNGHPATEMERSIFLQADWH